MSVRRGAGLIEVVIAAAVIAGLIFLGHVVRGFRLGAWPIGFPFWVKAAMATIPAALLGIWILGLPLLARYSLRTQMDQFVALVCDGVGLTAPVDFGSLPEPPVLVVPVVPDLLTTLSEVRRRLEEKKRRRYLALRLVRDGEGWLLTSVDSEGRMWGTTGRLVLAESPGGPVLELRALGVARLTTPRACAIGSIGVLGFAALGHWLWPSGSAIEVGSEPWLKAICEGLLAVGGAMVSAIPLMEALAPPFEQLVSRGSRQIALETMSAVVNEIRAQRP